MSNAEHAELKENVTSEMNNELELAHIRIGNAWDVRIHVDILNYDETERLINNACENKQEKDQKKRNRLIN